MNYVWLRKTPRIIQSAGYGTTLLFDLLNFPTPTATPVKAHQSVFNGFFSHGSSADNIVEATMAAQLKPSTKATCALPQCGWGGVYFFRIENSDNSKPIPNELVVAAWKQSVDSGYTVLGHPCPLLWIACGGWLKASTGSSGKNVTCTTSVNCEKGRMWVRVSTSLCPTAFSCLQAEPCT
jgi:hypothetical protein